MFKQQTVRFVPKILGQKFNPKKNLRPLGLRAQDGHIDFQSSKYTSATADADLE